MSEPLTKGLLQAYAAGYRMNDWGLATSMVPEPKDELMRDLWAVMRRHDVSVHENDFVGLVEDILLGPLRAALAESQREVERLTRQMELAHIAEVVADIERNEAERHVEKLWRWISENNFTATIDGGTACDICAAITYPGEVASHAADCILADDGKGQP